METTAPGAQTLGRYYAATPRELIESGVTHRDPSLSPAAVLRSPLPTPSRRERCGASPGRAPRRDPGGGIGEPYRSTSQPSALRSAAARMPSPRDRGWTIDSVAGESSWRVRRSAPLRRVAPYLGMLGAGTAGAIVAGCWPGGNLPTRQPKPPPGPHAQRAQATGRRRRGCCCTGGGAQRDPPPLTRRGSGVNSTACAHQRSCGYAALDELLAPLAEPRYSSDARSPPRPAFRLFADAVDRAITPGTVYAWHAVPR